jgi:hypothetical protein
MKEGINERVKSISMMISDNMGYATNGGAQWGTKAMKEMAGSINFERVYEYIRGERRKRRIISLIDSEKKDIIFNIARGMDNINQHFCEEYGISEEDADIIISEFHKCRSDNDGNLDEKIVIDAVRNMKMSQITSVMGRPIDNDTVEFAIMYNNSRIPYKEPNVIPPDQMENICNKTDMLMYDADNAEERDAAAMDILNILHDKYGKRRLRNKGTNPNYVSVLMHECAKTMLKYGIVPSESYREWGDQAIALAFLCRINSQSVRGTLRKMASSLFELSHFDEHPEQISENIVDKCENLMSTIEDADIPIGTCLKHAFLSMDFHDERYLFNILSRISTNFGRKADKRKRRRKR